MSSLLNALVASYEKIEKDKEKFWVAAFISEAIKSDPRVARLIPKEMITEELALELVAENGFSIYHIPTEIRTYAISLKAFERYCSLTAFQEMPRAFLTSEMLEAALKSVKGAIQFVPDQLITSSVLFRAMTSKNTEFGWDDVPGKFLTEEFVLSVLRQAPSTIQTLPAVRQTNYVRRKAIEIDPVIVLGFRYEYKFKVVTEDSDKLASSLHVALEAIRARLATEGPNCWKVRNYYGQEVGKILHFPYLVDEEIRRLEILEDLLRQYSAKQMESIIQNSKDDKPTEKASTHRHRVHV